MDLRLARLRIELFTAAQQLTGEDFDTFEDLIREVHTVVALERGRRNLKRAREAPEDRP